jgi:hypothetical protein
MDYLVEDNYCPVSDILGKYHNDTVEMCGVPSHSCV